MGEKKPLRPSAQPPLEQSSQPRQDADLDAIWRLAVGLDLGDRSVLEAEVLLWRICQAKSMSRQSTERALSEEWEVQ